MPPADFCSSASPEHTSDPSKPRHLVRRQAAAWQVAAPLAEPHQPRCLRLGVALAFRPFRPPPRRPLAAQDLPQPNCLGHPLSQPRALVHLKASTLRRPCGYGLSRTESPSKSRRSATCLVGPPPARSRERARTRPHPGCLPSPRPPVTGKRPPPPLDESRDLGQPTPLLPTSTPSLTGLASRWLGHPEH
jgi:hypothetical protein